MNNEIINEYKLFSLNKFRKIKKNSFNNKNECIKHKNPYGTEMQTNPKFKLFDQIYFHAGDEEDIKKYGLLPLRYVYSKDIINKSKSNKLSKIPSIKFPKIYKKIDYVSVLNTFNYLFKKFKKGIFIIIRDNKLITFLPFSNAKYINNWYKKTYFSLEEKRLLETNQYKNIQNQLNKNIIEFQKQYPHQFKSRKINFNRKAWYANNCFFRNLFPTYEGELNTNVIKDMLESLLKERRINDVEFFINDRDFPLLKKDLTEPYNHLFDGDNIPIEDEYKVDKMCPIMSKSTTNKFNDILFPTNDDWLLASNRFFTDDCKNSYRKNSMNKLNKKWDTKKPICIFRGSATGCGITLNTNMRLKASDLSIDYPDLLDAGIIDWNSKMKKYKNEPIKIIDEKSFRFKLANKIDNETKSNYKYILNIDGNVSAFRLSSELCMNSVVLIVKSEYKLWFSNMLIPYEHYIPVKSDLSDLIDQIKWCKNNDSKCKEIAEYGMKFYEKYLSKDGIFNYLSSIFLEIHKNRNIKNLLNIKKSTFTKSVKSNVAIITCFRDKGDGARESQRKIFIQLLNTLLKPYFKFHIYIIEQSKDNEDFNIGKLKNIGFDIANKNKKKYTNFIFSDIDTIPDYDLINYYTISEDYPIALASRGTRYEKKDIRINKPFLGALLGFTKKTFEEINGYPNNFWGWGGEDDALMNRLLANGKKYICIPKVGSIIDFEEKNMKTLSIMEKVPSENKDQLKFEKLYNDLKTWKKNGLSNLEYKILEKTEINENTTQIKVDLMKKMNETKYHNLYPNISTNFRKLEEKVKKGWKNIIIKNI